MEVKRTLRNGLRIIAVPMRGTEAVTILVLVKTGSKYEEAKISGVSHFLEHMFFKGSAKYPTVRKLTEALDLLGAEYNAFTDKEVTGFWVKVAKDNFRPAIAVVADMLKNPRFPKSEVERERGVVLEELNLYFDTPARFIGDLWEKVLYGDQPAGRYVGGTPETVQAITHRDIVEHFERYYRAPAMVVAIAGSLNYEEAFRTASAHFGNVRGGRTPDHAPVVEEQLRPNLLLKRKATDQTHLAVGFRGVSLTHPMRHAMTVLAAILGGTMSSRLFLLIRDRLGLAYSIHTAATFDTETGSFVTIAGVRNAEARRALDAILAAHRTFLRKGPTVAEVKKAKEAIVGRFVLGLEETNELAAFIATQELLLEHIRTPHEEIRSIRRVTPRAVHEAARFLFRHDRLNLALIGRDTDRPAWYRQLSRAFASRGGHSR
jgi:predicted Zn-dependent peptidase